MLNEEISQNNGPPAHNLRSRSVRHTCHTYGDTADATAAVPTLRVTMDAAAVRQLTNALHAMSVPQDIEKFAGKGTRDVTKWLQDYDVMATSKNWNDADNLRLFPNFLTTNARVWFHGLPQNAKDEWQRLRAAFVQNFALTSAERWSREQALRSKKQRPGETLKEYIAELREEADAINLDEDAKINIVWHNMAPANKNFITNKPATLQAFLNTPLGRGEVAPPDVSGTQSEDIQALRSEVRGLTAQLSTFVASMGTSVAAGGVMNATQPSFMAGRLPHPNNAPKHHNSNEGYPRPEYQRPNYQRQGPPGGRYQEGGGRSQPWHDQAPRLPPRNQCRRCGGFCTNRRQCAAINQRCRRCNKLDHFADMCRTVPNHA